MGAWTKAAQKLLLEAVAPHADLLDRDWNMKKSGGKGLLDQEAMRKLRGRIANAVNEGKDVSVTYNHDDVRKQVEETRRRVGGKKVKKDNYKSHRAICEERGVEVPGYESETDSEEEDDDEEIGFISANTGMTLYAQFTAMHVPTRIAVKKSTRSEEEEVDIGRNGIAGSKVENLRKQAKTKIQRSVENVAREIEASYVADIGQLSMKQRARLLPTLAEHSAYHGKSWAEVYLEHSLTPSRDGCVREFLAQLRQNP